MDGYKQEKEKKLRYIHSILAVNEQRKDVTGWTGKKANTVEMNQTQITPASQTPEICCRRRPRKRNKKSYPDMDMKITARDMKRKVSGQ